MSSSDLVSFLHKYFPSQIALSVNESELSHLSTELFPDTPYSENEKVEMSQWLITSAHLSQASEAKEDQAKHAERLGSLNIHLSTRTTLLGSKPSIADLALWHRLAPAVKKWTPDERTGQKGYHHIIRHLDFAQNAPLLRLAEHLEPSQKIDIDPSDVRFYHKPIDAKAEKEKKKKEKAAAVAAAGGGDKTLSVGKPRDAAAASAATGNAPASDFQASKKKDKKEKQGSKGNLAGGSGGKNNAPSTPPPLSPRLIDLRVGHILKAIPHPDADSLYVSTIACGDAAGADNTSDFEGQVVRTVCSGLNGLVPLAEMQGRRVVVVCNLKPVTMRGVKSAAMVLAASPRLKPGEEDNHKGPVELVDPPAGSAAGERCCFEGYEGEPEGVLNPKKKIFETLQPGLGTAEDAEGAVAFDAKLVAQMTAGVDADQPAAAGRLKTKSGGLCTVKSLRGAIVR